MSNSLSSHAGHKPPGAAERLAQAAAVLPSAALWARMALRVGSTYGPPALLLSPPMGWLPLFFFWWLQASLGRT